mgnify:CR=1 FL=1
MIAGNKTDLRTEYEAEGRRCVKSEEGRRLARVSESCLLNVNDCILLLPKEFDALFIETSAKEGDYILEAVTELAR